MNNRDALLNRDICREAARDYAFYFLIESIFPERKQLYYNKKS